MCVCVCVCARAQIHRHALLQPIALLHIRTTTCTSHPLPVFGKWVFYMLLYEYVVLLRIPIASGVGTSTHTQYSHINMYMTPASRVWEVGLLHVVVRIRGIAMYSHVHSRERDTHTHTRTHMHTHINTHTYAPANNRACL